MFTRALLLSSAVASVAAGFGGLAELDPTVLSCPALDQGSESLEGVRLPISALKRVNRGS